MLTAGFAALTHEQFAYCAVVERYQTDGSHAYVGIDATGIFQ